MDVSAASLVSPRLDIPREETVWCVVRWVTTTGQTTARLSKGMVSAILVGRSGVSVGSGLPVPLPRLWLAC
jgi:hypothetical protein